MIIRQEVKKQKGSHQQQSGVWDLRKGQEVQCKDTDDHGDHHEHYSVRGLTLVSSSLWGSGTLALAHCSVANQEA